MFERRTKIIATLGPALDPEGVLERLLDSGVDVLRVNMSHASPREQAARVRARARTAPTSPCWPTWAAPSCASASCREDVADPGGRTW